MIYPSGLAFGFCWAYLIAIPWTVSGFDLESNGINGAEPYCMTDDLYDASVLENPEIGASRDHEDEIADKYQTYVNSLGTHPFLRATYNGNNDRRRRRLLDTSQPLVRIPLVWHILYGADRPEHNLPDSQIESQLNAINEDFRSNNEYITDYIFDVENWGDRLGDTKLEFYTHEIIRKEMPTGNYFLCVVEYFSVFFSLSYDDVKSVCV